jgi:hypothetical protein
MKITRSDIAHFLAGKGCRLRLWIGLSYWGGAKERGRKRDCAPPVIGLTAGCKCLSS